MAIISANRFSKMNGNFIIAANESYGVEDMGRILVENERNDQAIFTAALLSDMHEIKCRTEGTLLESEIEALAESSVKDFFDKIIEKLKKFWAKIKGFFKRAYAMITAYVVRNGKAFIAANRKELNKLTNESEVKGDVYVPSENAAEIKFEIFTLEQIEKLGHDDSAAEMTKALLGKATNDRFNEDGNFYKWLKENSYEKATNPKLKAYGGLNKLLAMLDNGMVPIKELKEKEKKAEKALQEAIKKLQNEQTKISKDNSKSDDEKKEAGKLADFYKTASSGMTTAMSTAISASVKLEKFKLAQARIALARAIAKNNVVESTLLESEIRQIIEDASEMEDSTPAPGEDPELDAATEKVVDAVEELIDQAAEEAADEGCDEE